MRTLFVSAAVLTLASGEASRALFSTPRIVASPMRTSAYGTLHVAPTVESTPYFQPLAPAFAVQRGQPERPFPIYTFAAALCGAAATVATINRAQPKAVAELDLESAASATQIAMLFSSGKAKPKTGRPALKKKPATRKPAAKKDAGSSFSFFGSGSAKPKATTTGRKVVKSSGRRAGNKVEEEELPFAGQVAVTLLSAPLVFAKAFFSEENWLIQAFKLLTSINADNKRKDNS